MIYTNRIREALKQIIKYGDFTLASGKKSNYYIDIWDRCFTVDFLKDVSLAFWKELITDESLIFNHVIGPESGASPLITAIVMNAPRWALPIYGTMIRREAYKGKYLEGAYKGTGKILLVDDVVTTGGSILKCISKINAEVFSDDPGKNVITSITGVFSILDRQEGYILPYPLTSLVKVSEILKKQQIDS